MRDPLPDRGEEEGAPRGAARGHAAAGLAAAALAGAWVLLKTWSLAPSLSDEFIYFYMCRRIAEGAIPYRDFFFAHPPLQLLPGALLTWIFGFSMTLARSIPAAASLIAGIAVYRIGRRAGALEGFLALVLFLFSYDLLRVSSHYNGAAESTALLAWALERALGSRAASAGILAAAAGLTAIYALPSAAAIALLLFATAGGWRRFAAWFAAPFLGVNLLALLAFGGDYWGPVVRYHLLKPASDDLEAASSWISFAAENNWLVWAAPAAALWFFFGARRGRDAPDRGDPGRTVLLAGLLAGAFQLAALLPSRRLFAYYFLPAFPGLAVAGGIAFGAALRTIARALVPARSAGAVTSDRPARRVPVGVAAALLVLAGAPASRAAAVRLLPPRAAPDSSRHFQWRDAPLPFSLNRTVRALLWSGDPPSAWTPAVTRYLQHESLRFEAPGFLAARISALTPPGAAIFGDSLTAPLVALLAERPIALDEADTNSMRYLSGVTSPADSVARLEGAPPEAIIASPGRSLFQFPEAREWLEERYRLAEVYEDPLFGPFLLYLRRHPPDDAPG